MIAQKMLMIDGVRRVFAIGILWDASAVVLPVFAVRSKLRHRRRRCRCYVLSFCLVMFPHFVNIRAARPSNPEAVKDQQSSNKELAFPVQSSSLPTPNSSPLLTPQPSPHRTKVQFGEDPLSVSWIERSQGDIYVGRHTCGDASCTVPDRHRASVIGNGKVR